MLVFVRGNVCEIGLEATGEPQRGRVRSSSRTVHGVLHIGWVEEQAGRYRGQMAVLVRRNGRLGATYMAAITPFRHLIVYPRMMREIERSWRGHAAPASRAHA